MLLQPYPGTAIADCASRSGAFDGDLSSIDFTYYQRSPLKFADPREKRRIENLQKLFAIAVEAPSLLPLILRLVELPQNLVFHSVFRTWFLWCYHTRIIPHRLQPRDVVAMIASVFGVYKREAFDGGPPEGEEGGDPHRSNRRGSDRRRLPRLLARLGRLAGST
jgi:hypothetical protein